MRPQLHSNMTGRMQSTTDFNVRQTHYGQHMRSEAAKRDTKRWGGKKRSKELEHFSKPHKFQSTGCLWSAPPGPVSSFVAWISVSCFLSSFVFLLGAPG
ncbi:hypothetical protein CHARACLAT_002576 [Characodon lateralis]|uniref:Uncharacterized protein n=1 Tax=Characodon lateralis TaxID=208331 RepID=A0ABU7CY15_9TELE|nr:hypothetical protein [Characodon lateralis]